MRRSRRGARPGAGDVVLCRRTARTPRRVLRGLLSAGLPRRAHRASGTTRPRRNPAEASAAPSPSPWSISTISNGSTTATATTPVIRFCGWSPSSLARAAGGKAYRYGGEEFAIVFPGKDPADVRERPRCPSNLHRRAKIRTSGARPAEDQARQTEEERAGSAKRVTVTVSIGVAGTNSRRRSPASVLKAADKALYRAKRAGRNRLVAAGDRLTGNTADLRSLGRSTISIRGRTCRTLEIERRRT